MHAWVAASWMACGGPAEVPMDSGLPGAPEPETFAPELGTWDERLPVGLVVTRPSTTFFGPVTVWWQQRVPFDVRIEFRLEGGTWQSSPVYQGVAGLNRQSIIGIPTGGTADVRIVGAGDVTFEASGCSVTTPGLPASFPRARVSASDASRWQPNGGYFLTSINQDSCSWCTGRYWTYIADRSGTVYWATRSSDNRQVLFPQISVAGGDHVLW
ncbi:MAG: hypothetical protein AAF602_13175, partial [Myxococcota bacterium]